MGSLWDSIGVTLVGTWYFILAALAGAAVGSVVPDTLGEGIIKPSAELIVGIIVFILLWVRRSKGESAQMQSVKRAIPVWERALKKWDTLYNCGRDDCVFDPATGKCVPPGRMSELLYD